MLTAVVILAVLLVAYSVRRSREHRCEEQLGWTREELERTARERAFEEEA